MTRGLRGPMMGGMRSPVLVLLLSVIAFSSLAACRSRPLPEPVRLTLRRADDGSLYSFEERRAPATIVYFFSTWCVPCQAMDAFVAETATIARKEGIETVAISLDTEAAILRPWVLQARPPYPVLFGGGSIAKGESPFGRIPELPAVIFLDGEGRPSSALLGLANTQTLLERAREVERR